MESDLLCKILFLRGDSTSFIARTDNFLLTNEVYYTVNYTKSNAFAIYKMLYEL